MNDKMTFDEWMDEHGGPLPITAAHALRDILEAEQVQILKLLVEELCKHKHDFKEADGRNHYFIIGYQQGLAEAKDIIRMKVAELQKATSD